MHPQSLACYTHESLVVVLNSDLDQATVTVTAVLCVCGALGRWAEGYGATVMCNEELPGVWTLKRTDQQPVDLSKVRHLGPSVA